MKQTNRLEGKRDLITAAGQGVGLASSESAFTTGQIHVIDGGWSS